MRIKQPPVKKNTLIGTYVDIQNRLDLLLVSFVSYQLMIYTNILSISIFCIN